MISLEEYAAWRDDPSRSNSRVLAVELDYAAGPVRAGHGRFNGGDTLNEVYRLLVRTYEGNRPTFGEVTFRQPRSQAGYHWEIWINGERVAITNRGNYPFEAPVGTSVHVAVASAKDDGSYSKPWTAFIVMNGTEQSVKGSLGDWADVGEGAGIQGIETVRLASRAYLDPETNRVYDDWLMPTLSYESSLAAFFGVGDVEALCPDPEVDWLDYRFRGYECRWYHGDLSWPISHFRRIASAINGGCLQTDDLLYRFDLIDAGLALRRTFLDADLTFSGTARAAIDDVMSRASLPAATYRNVPDATLAALVTYEMTPETRAEEAVRRIAASIDAEVRITQSGALEVFRPDQELITTTIITEADVLDGGVRMVEVLPAYSRVQVNRPTGPSSIALTGTLTGELAETLEVDSVLQTEVDTDALAARLVERHRVGLGRWELDLSYVGGDIAEGAVIGVDVGNAPRRLRGVALVRRVTREPLSGFSQIEIEMEVASGERIDRLPAEPLPGRAPGPPDAPDPDATINIEGDWRIVPSVPSTIRRVRIIGPGPSEVQAELAALVAEGIDAGSSVDAAGLGFLTAQSLAYVDILRGRGVAVSHDALGVAPETMTTYTGATFAAENGIPL